MTEEGEEAELTPRRWKKEARERRILENKIGWERRRQEMAQNKEEEEG